MSDKNIYDELRQEIVFTRKCNNHLKKTIDDLAKTVAILASTVKSLQEPHPKRLRREEDEKDDDPVDLFAQLAS